MRTASTLGLSLLAASLVVVGVVGTVAAQSAAGESRVANATMPHVLATASAGRSVRLRRDRRLGQGRLAPAYGDVFAAYVLPGDGGLQHGFGVTGSLGLTEDGGFYEPVEVWSQLLVAPTYVLYSTIDADWVAVGHIAVPVGAIGGTTLGLDVGGALAYRVLAGVGIFAELSGVMFLGVEQRLYPMVAAELGVLLDYEVLP